MRLIEKAVLLAVMIATGCSPGDEIVDAGGQATMHCLRWCDHQLEAGCDITSAYEGYCDLLCEATTEMTPEECHHLLLIQQRCAASLDYECSPGGSPKAIGNCGPESSDCAQCAGTLCSAALGS